MSKKRSERTLESTSLPGVEEHDESDAMRTLSEELSSVATMSHASLVARYTELAGRAPRSRNTAWLRKRVASLVQEQASPRPPLPRETRVALEKMADEAEARLRTRKSRPQPRPTAPNPVRVERQRLIPQAGSTITRVHNGVTHVVTVLDDGGFEYAGARFKSLSGIAKQITGVTWNGLLFFGFVKREASATAAKKIEAAK